ncbi:MAG TPA: hypothetical protein VIY73_05040, partial [Polyangiaceae bacterium]
GMAARCAAVVSLGVLGLSACGGAPPPEAKAPEPEEHVVKPQLRTKSELGTVDPNLVQAAFHKLADKFEDCQKQGLSRVEVLAGNAKFFLRIGEDGSAKWAYLEDGSDVGDADTEKCLIGAVMGARWPKPDGGDAEARYSIELPPDGRPASDWSSDKVAAALGKHGDAIDKCKSSGGGKAEATMYVGPGGRVLTAGVVTSRKDGDDEADCLVKVLEKMKGLPSPGSWPAKVSFGL